MVEVFKTNIVDPVTADHILYQFQKLWPAAKINLDLEDCDNILRIEDCAVSIPEVVKLASDLGFYCEVLL